MGKGIKVIQSDCDPTSAQDKTLPNNAYLVEYLQDEITKFDIVMAGTTVDIFDEYYDRYKKDFKNMTQAEGRANPKLWGIQPKETKKKK